MMKIIIQYHCSQLMIKHNDIYSTIVQKFVVSKIFNVIDRSLLCSTRLHLFDQNYSKHNNIVNYHYNLK